MDSLLKTISASTASITGSAAGSNNGSGGSGDSGLQSMIKSLSITGNIMIDSFIIMNAFTFLKEWAEIFIKLVISFAKTIFSTISHYVISYVKSKLTGRIVFRSDVSEEDPLYKIMFNNIINSNIEGDVQEDWKFKWLKMESSFLSDDSEISYFDRMKKNEYYHTIPVSLSIDYNATNDQKLKFNQNYGMSDKKVLIFKYVSDPKKKYNSPFMNVARTFYVRISWVQHEVHHHKGGDEPPSSKKRREIKFDLILFDVPSKIIPKSVYFTVFYDFLNERFKHVFENMVFSYRINFTASTGSNM